MLTSFLRRRVRTVAALALLAGLTAQPASAQQPIQTELLQNPGFETGDTSGWTIATSSAAAMAYDGAETPTGAIAAQFGGGSFLARADVGTALSVLTQSFDLNGNATAIDAGQLVLAMSGYFGGFANDPDLSELRARFLDAGAAEIGTLAIGAISSTNRNEETTFLRREGDAILPAGTRSLEIELRFVRQSGVSNRGFADELSVSLISLANFAPSALPLDTELLDRADFEASTLINPALASGWTSTSGIWGLPAYGDLEMPDPSVATAIGGGSQLAVLNSNIFSGSLEQTFDLRGNAADVDADLLSVSLEGYFGGFSTQNDRAMLSAIFLDALGAEMVGTELVIGDISDTERNAENTLMRRRGAREIPVGARTMIVRVTHTRGTGIENQAICDQLSARIVADGATIPAALALDTELIDNGSVAGDAIVNPNLASGWTVRTGRVAARLYGDLDLPSTDVSIELGGGARHFQSALNTSVVEMEQRFELGGNAADVDAGNLHLALSGHFGGIVDDADRTSFSATFYDATEMEISGAGIVIGDVSQTNRNNDATLLLRTGAVAVPVGARAMVLTLSFDRFSGVQNNGVADNLSATLRAGPPPPPGVATFSDLVRNGDFEDDRLTPATYEAGWIGTNGTFAQLPYGDPTLPSTARAAEIGGGSQLLAAAVSGAVLTLEHRFLVAADATSIDLGQAEFTASAYLGGRAGDNDEARIDLHYLDASGQEIALDSIGPVTAADRNFLSDVLFREGTFAVPTGTREIVLELVFQRLSGTANDALADLVTGRFDILDHPGSDEDLRLRTGLSGSFDDGPANDRKHAFPGEALVMLVDSPMGSRLFQPLVLVAQTFATGTNLLSPFGFPTVHVNPGVPGLVVILDGASSGGIFGPPVVFPGGTVEQALIPSGGAGISVMIQALALDSSAANGFFAATNGHEIILN
jgi:hypothetical protein